MSDCPKALLILQLFRFVGTCKGDAQSPHEARTQHMQAKGTYLVACRWVVQW